MKDRREHKRYFLKALLQADKEGEYSNVTLESINLSAGGLLLRASGKIQVGDTFSTSSAPDSSSWRVYPSRSWTRI